MSFNEPQGGGRNMLMGGCLVLLLVGGGLFYFGRRVSTREDAMHAEAAAKAAEAEAKKIEEAIAAKQVLVGMTREEVERAWGKPDRTNRSSSGAGVREQWAYASGSYVYFGNDKVTSVEK